jgi:hypothetical protein
MTDANAANPVRLVPTSGLFPCPVSHFVSLHHFEGSQFFLLSVVVIAVYIAAVIVLIISIGSMAYTVTSGSSSSLGNKIKWWSLVYHMFDLSKISLASWADPGEGHRGHVPPNPSPKMFW